MTKKMFESTPVIFRKFEDEITAFFPTLPGSINPSTCTCYAHVGQHGIADVAFYKDTKPVTETEYADLKNELENMMEYSLIVYKHWLHKFDLERYQELKNN